ncbi:MAG: hypothetical protein QOI42_612 [Frankiaceae bacterium]|nr:hypothetical protein [Frankiaceae bacterium]
MTDERCDWCGKDVEADDGWRASEPAGERRAVFCRLEHVFPWWAKGPHWGAGTVPEPPGLVSSITECAECGTPLPDTRVLLVRHRGEHRVADGFCTTDHMAEWAKKGGRWR